MPHARSGIGLNETQVTPRSCSDSTSLACAFTCTAFAARVLIRHRPLRCTCVNLATGAKSRPVRTTFPPRPSQRRQYPYSVGNVEDTMTLFRREFLQLIAGAAAAPSVAFRPAAAAQET